MRTIAPSAPGSLQNNSTRWLLTADWQATPTNLNKLEELCDQICRLVVKHKVSYVIHLGDVKEAYNPVDVRVTETVRQILQKIASLCKVIILNGNHDRLSQVKDKEHWGKLITDGTDIVYIDKQRSIKLDGQKCLFAPWTQQPQLTLRTNDDYIFIHSELRGALLNSSGRASKSGTETEAGKGVYAGHVHGQQKLKNGVWVVGSPFPHTWSEANETKGMLLVNPGTGGTTPIPSSFQGWYDPSLPGFPKKKHSWRGARLRITQPEGTNRVQVISKLQALYVGADITLVPETAERVAAEAPKNFSDQDLIRRFANHSLYADKILLSNTILTALEQTTKQHGISTGFELLSITCRNVLSFQRLSYRYQPGLTVLRGINEDLKDDSNGSGKTNFFQLPALLLYGRTRKGKGQLAERWRRRGSKGICWIEGEVKLDDGRLLRIRRGREPLGLQIWVDGKDVTSGKQESVVQQRLEQWLGCNWEAFVVNMFVDQQQQSTILHGTPAQRQQLFSEVLNLGRFDVADAFLHKQLRRNQKVTIETKLLYENAVSTLTSLKQQISFMGDESALRLALQEAEAEVAVIKTLEPQKPDDTQLITKQNDYAKAREKARDGERKLKELTSNRLGVTPDICPYCGNPMDKLALKAKRQKLLAETTVMQAKIDKLRKVISTTGHTYRLSERHFLHTKRQHQVWSNQLMTSSRAESLAKTQLELTLEAKSKFVQVLDVETMRVKYLKGSLLYLADQAQCLVQARVACSRKGLPQELTKLLVPKLNKAIRRYAVLTEHKIKAQFTDTGGAVDVKISNPYGGGDLESQSLGETQMLSLMVSLGLREVTGRTQLLVCDEPGTGLSPVHSTDFAGILLGLPDRFAKVLVASHNKDLLEGLGSTPSVTVRKRDGISRMEK